MALRDRAHVCYHVRRSFHFLPTRYVHTFAPFPVPRYFLRYMRCNCSLWSMLSLPRATFSHVRRMFSYVMSTTTPKVPGEVNDPAGVGNDDFDQGLKESKYGYPVTGLYKLKTPLTTSQLRERFDIATPQGWRYATRKLVEELPLAEMESMF